jgi:hypothetical protein
MKIFTKRTKLVKKAGFKRKTHIIIEIPFRTEWDFFYDLECLFLIV